MRRLRLLAPEFKMKQEKSTMGGNWDISNWICEAANVKNLRIIFLFNLLGDSFTSLKVLLSVTAMP
jgi:hypothetical protein